MGAAVAAVCCAGGSTDLSPRGEVTRTLRSSVVDERPSMGLVGVGEESGVSSGPDRVVRSAFGASSVPLRTVRSAFGAYRTQRSSLAANAAGEKVAVLRTTFPALSAVIRAGKVAANALSLLLFLLLFLDFS